jgi:hypothetical protein
MTQIRGDGNGRFGRTKSERGKDSDLHPPFQPLVVALISTSSINSLGNEVSRNPCA